MALNLSASRAFALKSTILNKVTRQHDDFDSFNGVIQVHVSVRLRILVRADGGRKQFSSCLSLTTFCCKVRENP